MQSSSICIWELHFQLVYACSGCTCALHELLALFLVLIVLSLLFLLLKSCLHFQAAVHCVDVVFCIDVLSEQALAGGSARGLA